MTRRASIAGGVACGPVLFCTSIHMRPSGWSVRLQIEYGSRSCGNRSVTTTDGFDPRSIVAARCTRAPPSPSSAATSPPLRGSSSCDVPRRSCVTMRNVSPFLSTPCSSVVDCPARAISARCHDAKPRAVWQQKQTYPRKDGRDMIRRAVWQGNWRLLSELRAVEVSTHTFHELVDVMPLLYAPPTKERLYLRVRRAYPYITAS